MVQDILRDFLIFAFAVLCSLLIDYKRSIRYWPVLLSFFIIGLMDNLFNTVTIAYPKIQIIKSHTWNNLLYCNWSPKIYSIIFVLILQFPLRKIISPTKIGLRLKQKDHSIRFSLLFILFFFVTASILGILGRKGVFDIKTLLFLALMPGLNEELIYRGFLLGLLNKIFDRRFCFFNTHFGWGVILTSIVFGLLHGLHLGGNNGLQFDMIPILLSGLYGFFFALIKERSGSLLFPILAHNTADFFSYFFKMI